MYTDTRKYQCKRLYTCTPILVHINVNDISEPVEYTPAGRNVNTYNEWSRGPRKLSLRLNIIEYTLSLEMSLTTHTEKHTSKSYGQAFFIFY